MKKIISFSIISLLLLTVSKIFFAGTDAVSGYTFSQSNTTYSSINTTGTLITSGCDDSYFLNYPIGFSFTFNSIAYTAFCVSCNGWMNLGTTGTNAYYTPICSGTNPSTIAPFARDLYGAASGNGLYYQTTGSAPNRVLTVEWYHWGIYSSGLNELDFEVKLYEGTNIAQFVYKPETPTTTITDPEVGIMGATNADYNTRTETTGWAATTPGTACSGCTFSPTYYPSSGLTFTWTPPCGVSSLPYSYGFGTSGTLDPCWSIVQVSGTGNWALATSMTNPSMTPFTPPYMCYFNSNTFTAATQSRLQSPPINFSGVSTPFVRFWMTRDNGYSTSSDSILVQVSTDNGSTWIGLFPAFPRPSTNSATYWECKSKDLSAFSGMSNVKVGFSAYSMHGNNMAIDSIQFLLNNDMAFYGSNTLQWAKGVDAAPGNNIPMLQIPVLTGGVTNPLIATVFSLGTNGSTNPAADISNAKIFYTGTTGTFSTTTQFGAYASPNGTFSITGSQTLASGVNYFWLTYDVPSSAVMCDILDAQCNSINGNLIPTITAPAGNRPIGKYCVGTFSYAGNCCCLWISNFTGNYINHSSGYDTNGNFYLGNYAYTNYAGCTGEIVDTFARGSTYNISISRPCNTNLFTSAIWIDFNENGSFSDTGEFFLMPQLASSGGLTTTRQITIPANALLGKTRLRIRNNFSTDLFANSACTNLSYGETEDYSVVITDMVGNGRISEVIPDVFKLAQNYPNPFNPVTSIKFQLPKIEFVTIKIFDILGREVAMLINEKKESGYYEVMFDGTNYSSGLYFYKIEAGEFVQTKKMVLIK